MFKDLIYFLPAEIMAQRFYKPDSYKDFVIYNDKGVFCPNKNPYKTNKGRISVTAVCYDCESFIEWVSIYDAVICKGKPVLKSKTVDLKEFLDPVEVPPDLKIYSRKKGIFS